MPHRIIFYGTPDFAVPALKALIDAPKFDVVAVVTQPDRPSGRGVKITASPVKQAAVAAGIPVLQPGSVRKEWPAFSAALRELGPIDAAVVAAFGQILPVDALKLPKAGSINIHASLLPRWRGAVPIQRAILAGDRATGIALMQMEAGLDTGAVYASARVPITGETTFESLHDELAKTGADLLVRELEEIIEGRLKPTPQPADGVTIASKITNTEAEISWNDPAEQIDRKIRAFNPVPGAFTFLSGSRLKIYKARLLPGVSPAAPGTISLADPRTVEVACGTGAIALQELQLEGRKRLSIQEFMRGVPFAAGTLLGR